MAENKKKSRVAEDVLENDGFSQIPKEVLFAGIDEHELGKLTGNDQSDNFPAAVIDASYFASAVLAGEGEKSVEAQSFIQSVIERNGQLFVPELFWFEIGNVLLGAAKQRKDGSLARITKKQLNDIFLLLSDLPLSTDMHPTAEIRLRILMIAQQENLTYYDAAYLELAQRYDIALKTWDDALQEAAARE